MKTKIMKRLLLFMSLQATLIGGGVVQCAELQTVIKFSQDDKGEGHRLYPFLTFLSFNTDTTEDNGVLATSGPLMATRSYEVGDKDNQGTDKFVLNGNNYDGR